MSSRAKSFWVNLHPSRRLPTEDKCTIQAILKPLTNDRRIVYIRIETSGNSMTFAETLIILGRSILGLFFVIAGIRNFLRLPERFAAATNYGWKLPAPVTVVGFVAQLMGGLSVLFGIFTVWGAGLLILFLIAATALYHNFMKFEGEARLPHLYFTLVNCALVGYCLMIIGTAL
jgi:putative oxidoreductase